MVLVESWTRHTSLGSDRGFEMSKQLRCPVPSATMSLPSIGTGELQVAASSVRLFGQSLKYLTSLVVAGRVASVEPFFLEPHGGDLEGFFLVRGDREELNKIRYEDDFQRMTVRAQVVVENFGVIGAITGEQLNKHMAWFAEAAKEVGVGAGAT